MSNIRNFKPVLDKTINIPVGDRIFIVGDIHGEHDLFLELLEKAGFNKETDHVICVGDLVDRGPKNLETLDLFIRENPRFHSVMGNHDMFMATFDTVSTSFSTWIYNGGSWSFDAFNNNIELEVLADRMLEKLPIFLTIKHGKDTYGVVHGGIPLNYEFTKEGSYWKTNNWFDIIEKAEEIAEMNQSNPDNHWRNLNKFIWDRDVPSCPEKHIGLVPEVLGVKFTFHGHTVLPEVLKVANRVYLDTGGTFNKKLSVAIIDSNADKLKIITTGTNEVKYI